jgi:hypothetical protein
MVKKERGAKDVSEKKKNRERECVKKWWRGGENRYSC